MLDFREYFAGKNIMVMGLGLLGRGVNVIKFLVVCGANLLVTDLKSAEGLGSLVKKLFGISLGRQ